MKRTSLITLLGSVGCILLNTPIYAHAYLDAGTGSMLIQLLFAGTAGIATLLRLFRDRIVRK